MHSHGSEHAPARFVNERLLNEQTRMLETLRAADSDYRGILTAAASLTSSLQSIRVAKTAIWVAMVSLGIAAITLLITDISKHSLFGIVAEWLGVASLTGRKGTHCPVSISLADNSFGFASSGVLSSQFLVLDRITTR